MKRRHALFGMAGLLAAGCALAQRAKIPVVGTLDGGERTAWWAVFRNGMRELGYVEGKNVLIETRFAKGNFSRLDALAGELVRLPVDIIVTTSTAAALAAKRATDTIPIVMASGSDHVSLGLAATLAKPGGNVTGLSTVATDLTAKRLELLRQINPKLSRLAVLWHRDNPGSSPAVRDLQHLSEKAKIALQNLGVRKGAEVGAAIGTAVEGRAEALYVVLSPITYAERAAIAAQALKYRLPTMNGAAEFAEAGGLVSYGADYGDLHRRAAIYVDKILRGAKPGDLPIEEPSKFDLVVNANTARMIGVHFPPTVLAAASRVIE
jgi:putative ABC transport system substrate-binding protein